MAGVPERGCRAIEPVHQGRDEAILTVPLQTLLFEPLRVVDDLEGVDLDGVETGNGARTGEEVVAQGFGHPQITDDAGADAHRHRFHRRR